ncbi:IFN-inducible antiviral protein MxE [Intoshia linei]|uniref:dynamin GTPase n=1 Tax=Intoshia linei TaxID=1819745 RepID=A0A177B8D4_9BILA|nr:IFN-inducible antiviral protein MxE [Intoshia linei]
MDADGLIILVSKLHHLFDKIGGDINIKLPQIVVIGSQSSGKSSVLENLVGRDFLPRGTGIVTRRPLRLNLITNNEEYAQFSHTNEKFTNFSDVRQEIINETERICKLGTVSSLPINLTIYSPQVLTLTMIDLPGLTKLSLPNQPKDLPMLIKAMVESFIKPPETIILAICAANTDLANADSLQLAKTVDPNGQRTIPVLTKLDLMDKGTNARDILDNQVIPMKHGYFAVVNRSQNDINIEKSMNDCREDEKKFFDENLGYTDISARLGSIYLQKYIIKLLSDKVKKLFPLIRYDLIKKREQLSEFLKKYNYMFDSDAKKSSSGFIHAMTSIVNQVSREFKLDIEGLGNVKILEESAGVKIYNIFHCKFIDCLKYREENEQDIRKEIETAIKNFHGLRVGIFIPDLAFETIVKNRINQLLDPSLQILSEITSIIMDSSIKYCINYMNLYPNLFSETDRILTDQIRLSEIDCISFIQKLNKKELDEPKDSEDIILTDVVVMSSFIPCFKFKYHAELSKNTLFLYKNKSSSYADYEIDLDDLSITLSKMNLISTRSIKLKKSNGENISNDINYLKFTPSTRLKGMEWLKCFNRCGVFCDDEMERPLLNNSKKLQKIKDNYNSFNRENVEQVRDLVEAYMNILLEQLRDLIPKIIVSSLINQIKEFLENSLLIKLLSINNPLIIQNQYNVDFKLYTSRLIFSKYLQNTLKG